MKKILIISLVTVLILYLGGPIIAGFNQIGERDGPIIYSSDFHTQIYIIAHEYSTGIKPRISMKTILYNRPWFYGFVKRPKPREERNLMIQRAQEKNSQILGRLKKWNQEIEKESSV